MWRYELRASVAEESRAERVPPLQSKDTPRESAHMLSTLSGPPSNILRPLN